MPPTKYGPKGNLSPTLNDPCALCGTSMMAGDFTTLVRPAKQHSHNAAPSEVHWDCAVRVGESTAQR